MKILKYVLAVLVVIVIIGFIVTLVTKPETPVGGTAEATVSILSVSPIDEASLAAAGSSLSSNTRVIKWQTNNYPSGAGVDLNLLRKISDSPVSYDLVRKIWENIPNSGSANWTPASNETGDDLYIEVTCGTGFQFDAGCVSTGSQPIKAY